MAKCLGGEWKFFNTAARKRTGMSLRRLYGEVVTEETLETYEQHQKWASFFGGGGLLTSLPPLVWRTFLVLTTENSHIKHQRLTEMLTRELASEKVLIEKASSTKISKKILTVRNC
jgi:hypothetical protein